MTRLVTAYAMRRVVCGYKPAAPPPVFTKAPRTIEPNRYVESVRAHFLSLPDGHAFPSDDAFRAELTSRRHCQTNWTGRVEPTIKRSQAAN